MRRAACIDMEGVLAPELWPYISSTTGILDLALTTREESDYTQLVNKRIALLRDNGLTINDIMNIVADIKPLPGATQFIEELSKSHHVIIVSDAFEEMIQPLWHMLGTPELRCHNYICDKAGFIQRAKYNRRRGKHEVIEELEREGFDKTLAVGDALNDLEMLRAATIGYLFKPSPETLSSAQYLTVAYCYQDILGHKALI